MPKRPLLCHDRNRPATPAVPIAVTVVIVKAEMRRAPLEPRRPMLRVRAKDALVVAVDAADLTPAPKPLARSGGSRSSTEAVGAIDLALTPAAATSGGGSSRSSRNRAEVVDATDLLARNGGGGRSSRNRNRAEVVMHGKPNRRSSAGIAAGIGIGRPAAVARRSARRPRFAICWRRSRASRRIRPRTCAGARRSEG